MRVPFRFHQSWKFEFVLRTLTRRSKDEIPSIGQRFFSPWQKYCNFCFARAIRKSSSTSKSHWSGEWEWMPIGARYRKWGEIFSNDPFERRGKNSSSFQVFSLQCQSFCCLVLFFGASCIDRIFWWKQEKSGNVSTRVSKILL